MIYVGVDGQAKQPVDIKVGVGGEAKTVSKIYTGVGGEAKLVYGGALKKILIKPYSRWLSHTYDPGFVWMTNDPETIESCGDFSYSGTQITQATTTPDRQIGSFHALYAVYEGGNMVDLGELAREGKTVVINNTTRFGRRTGTDMQYGANAAIGYKTGANPSQGQCIAQIRGQVEHSTYSFSTTVPSTFDSVASVLHYNADGTNATKKAFLLYLTSNMFYSTAPFIEVNFTGITVDGVSVPIELSSDWGDR